MISDKTRAELRLMAQRAWPLLTNLEIGESSDGRLLYVYVDGQIPWRLRVEHDDPDKAAHAMWSALNALQPDKPRDAETLDQHGYPTSEFLQELAEAKSCKRVFEMAREYFEHSGHGRVWEDGNELRFATGGWSGCEDVIDGVMANPFGALCWERSERGGLWVFVVREIGG